MPFDPAIFEAEVALKLIPTEDLPAIARDAVEAGFDGPHVIRMAVVEPTGVWEIDQALPRMLAELGCQPMTRHDAALRLAYLRAERILRSGEEALQSISYFYKLMLAADYPPELIELGYFDEDDFFLFDDPAQREKRAREAIEELLSPELRQKRQAERQKVWEQEQAKIKSEWPYVLDSPTGHALLKERYKEKVSELKPFLWIELIVWIVAGWAFDSWRTTVVGYIINVPLLFALPILGEYWRMRRERRYLLLRRGVPEEEI